MKKVTFIIVMALIAAFALALAGCSASPAVSASAGSAAPASSASAAASTAAASESASASTAASAAASGAGVVIRYGYQPGHAQIVVAQQQGLLDKEFGKDGIKFELSKFASGPALISAITGGSLDFGQVGDQPAIQAKANNVDIKAIGVYSTTDKANALIASKTSGITKIADLKGKKVGVTIGSTGQQLLYIYLKSVGLTTADIQQVNLQPGDIVSALVSGNIDAAVTWEPYVTLSIAKAGAAQIADGTGYKKEVDVIVGTSKFLQANPDVTVRLLRVLDQAQQWIAGNRDQALAIVAKDAGLDASALAPAYNKVSLDIRLTDEDIQSVKATEAFLKENNIIRTDVDVNSLIDTSYLQKAGLQ